MLRVRTVFTGVQGTPYYSNLFFGGTTEGEAVVAQDAVRDFWAANSALICTPLRYDVEGDVARIDPATGDILEVFQMAPLGNPFTGAGEAAPLASQVLVQWRTGRYINGRELRGRMFIPYMVITIVDDGRVDSAAATTIEGRVTAFLTAASGAGGAVVWSRTHGEAAAITGSSVWRDLAVMRSRRD